MNPPIQYVKARDGVSIAYWELGDGPALIHSWGVASHAQLEWRFPEIQRWYRRLGRRWRLISYEKRGIGMSQRDVDDFSLDAHVADLEAVVERLGLASFTLFAPMLSTAVAVAYAVRHSESGIRLVLWNGWRRHADIGFAAPLQATASVLEQDWVTFTETYAHVLLGWDQGDPAHRYAEMMRQSITPAAYRRRAEAMSAWDIGSLLPSVRAETLVLQRDHLSWLDLSVGREIASSIPNARFVVLDGSSVPPFLGNMEAVATAVDELLKRPTKPVATSARPTSPAPTRPAFQTHLSPRQREVLGLLAAGKTNREIASELVLSLRTVERHVNDIYTQLGVRNRSEAVAFALRNDTQTS